MKKAVGFLFAITLMLAGCGGDEGISEGPTDPNAPVLDSIGNKTITVGDPALSFVVSANDPNELDLIFSTNGSVGSGANPYTSTGSLASFTPSSGQFSWDVTGVVPDDYFIQFTATNTNSESDSETIRIRVQQRAGQFENGEQKYNDRCESCHGPGGRFGDSAGEIQCIDATTYNEKVNGGSMTGYTSGWSDADKDDVYFYLQNVDSSRC